MLNVNDFQGMDIHNDWCALDFLVEAASVARDKLEKERRERLVEIDQIFKKALSLTKKRTPSRSRDKTLSFSMKEWLTGQESVQKAVETESGDKIIKKKEGFFGVQAKKERLTAEKIPVKKHSRNNAKRDRDSFEFENNCQESGLKFKRQKCRNLDFGDMPSELKDRIKNMGGSNVVRVIKKSLFATDVNPLEARLSIPLMQVREEFLTEEEMGVLKERNGKELEGVEAMLIEPSLYDSKLCLRRWSSNKSYALIRGWNSVVQRNELKEGDIIELWSFRVGLELWFALVVVETGEKGANTSSVGIVGGEVASTSQAFRHI